MRKRYLAPALWLFSLIYTFPVYNKYWAPFDEGIIAVAAQNLLARGIPYKDFFIVMYPPGQIYALAAIFKIFSGSLIAGRVYALFTNAAIAALSFYITRAITKRIWAAAAAYIIVLSSLGPRLGIIPSPIWPGVMLSLFSIYLFIRYLKNPGYLLAGLAGLSAGLTILFRHDMGLFVFIAILIPSILGLFNRRPLGHILLYILGAVAVTLTWILYFVRASAGRALFESLIAFPFVHEKTAIIQLQPPCFDLNMIFHKSLYFINVNQFYIPLIVYGWISAIILFRFLKGRILSAENLALIALVSFGAVTYKETLVRADPAHLLFMIAPCVILSAYIVDNALSSKGRPIGILLPKYAISALLIFLFFLVFVKNTDKYLKNGYTKAFRGDIIKTSFDKGSIYVPKEERQELLDTIEFIRNNTAPAERIYVGNAAHWKDDFGGTLLLYYLADRLPSTKYYELLPGLVTDKKVQEEIAQSLVSKDVRLIVLQDVELGSLRKEDAPEGSLVLDNFIKAHYVPVKKIGKFNILKRR